MDPVDSSDTAVGGDDGRGVLYAIWAVWLCVRATGGIPTFDKRRVSARRAYRGHETCSVYCSKRVCRALFGWQDESPPLEWFDRNRTTPPPSPPPTRFVAKYGTILGTYRGTRQWFIACDFCMALLCGILSGVTTVASATTCQAIAWVLFAVLVVQLLLVMILQPYHEPLDHIVCVVTTVCAVGWGIATQTTSQSEVIAAAFAEAQMWIGVALLGLSLGLLALSSSFREWAWALIQARFVVQQQQQQQQQQRERESFGDDAACQEEGEVLNTGDATRGATSSARTKKNMPVQRTPEEELKHLVERICDRQRTLRGLLAHVQAP